MTVNTFFHPCFKSLQIPPQFLPIPPNIPKQKKVGGKQITGSTAAIVDSGTSLLAGPTKDVQALADQIGAHNIFGRYIVSCSADIGEVEFTLSGKKFTLQGKDLLIPAMLGQCLLAVIPIDVPAPRGPLWILGRGDGVLDLGGRLDFLGWRRLGVGGVWRGEGFWFRILWLRESCKNGKGEVFSITIFHKQNRTKMLKSLP